MTTLSIDKDTEAALESIRDYCLSNNKTIAIAESVTSGCIQLLISTVTRAQEFYQGGITTYNGAQKAIHLNIEPLFAESCNGVDENITAAMAKEVCALFRSQIGIGITGYATKVPEDGINELYAFIAIVKDNDIIHQSKITPPNEGIAAQQYYAITAIKLLAKALSGVSA